MTPRLCKIVSGLLAILGLVLAAGRASDQVHAAGPAVPDYPVAVASDSPRGYWRLGEAPNVSTATDSSGNSLSGTYGSKVVRGKYAAALLYAEDLASHFDGADGYLVGDDYVSMGNPAGLNFGTGDFTVEAWISTEVSNDRPIVGKLATPNSSGWEIVVTDDPGEQGHVRAFLYDGSPSPLNIIAYGPSIRVDDGEFHHVVVVFDRDQAVTIYVDRVAAQRNQPMTGSVSSSAPFRIGGTTASASFNGEIDEVAVYPTALSPARVRAHYDAGIDPPRAYSEGTLGDGPVGYWRLGDVVTPGGTAVDSRGAGLNGTYGLTQSSRSPGALVGDSDNAAAFTGVDGVSVGDAAALDFGTDDFSAEAWIRTGVNQEQAIVGKVEGSALPRWVMTVTDDAGFVGRLRAEIDDGTTSVVAYGPARRVDDGQWHHLAIAADRDLGVTVMVDGIENFTGGAAAGNVSNAGSFRIGQAVGYNSFAGDIDEVAVYAYVADLYRLAAHQEAGANPSERVLPDEEPDITDTPMVTTRDDSEWEPPPVPSRDIYSFHQGNPQWYEAEQAAAWQDYLNWNGAPEPDPTPEEPLTLTIEENATALQNEPVDPSDSVAAVGRKYVIEMVNRRIAVYKKTPFSPTGDPHAMDLVDFVRQPCLGGEFDVVDPYIIWDNETNRWYYLALMGNDSTVQNCLVYGWSKRPNPADLVSGWCHRHTTVTRTSDDYPKLGDNQGWMLVGTNVLANSIGLYRHSLIYAFEKPDRGPVSCSADWPRWHNSGPLRPLDDDVPFSPIPSNANFGHPHTAGWVVGVDYATRTAAFWRVREVNGVPEISPMRRAPSRSWSLPSVVDQPGDKNLDAKDGRFTNAVARRDPTLPGNPPPVTVWTQHTVHGQRGRSRILWYQFIPGASSVADRIRQDDQIVKSTYFVFNGAISPAWNGTDVMIHYNTANPSTNVQIFARARSAQTPLRRFGRESDPLYTSPNPYDDVIDTECEGVGPCDWGDYAAAVPEPLHARWIWGVNQAVTPPAGEQEPWLTRVFAGRVSD